ncbi:3-oxoacyl-[acyl-carrier-protein] reductase FabG [Pirellula sp. SH-Sr6A]|uniref:oxidoreductase n=1 Tax=Pirellula sp. SH-Sr6A TaxID=1632865 RepID=UPI00078B7A4B|nr:oxidoreductase [Pirellula sp. SH-Sr6A]AMV31515.1 3-oxoacyl-[acyl-carrier-protein] reductase FabG [Pirellula sp. SH-Sr6A]
MTKQGENVRVALVTGASSGIGKATAELLAKVGYKAFGTSRRGGSSGAQPFEMLPLDVTNDDSVNAAVSEVIRREGRIDLLVNNAGFSLATAGAEESSIAQVQALFDTNFFGIVRMNRAVLPQMRDQQSGRIINIGSIVGFLPAPFMAFYSASKHAVEGYSQSLDHEIRTLGIRVVVIEPAGTNTQIDANAWKADSHLEVYREGREIVGKRLTAMIEKGDSPSEVAAVVLKAATAARPHLRYTVGREARKLRLFSSFAPARLLDAALRKQMGLNALRRR